MSTLIWPLLPGDKSGMADGYWKPAHAARLEALAANAVLAALVEAEE
ncbi:hypothetical protein ACTDI4_05530 [Mesorhizobium sp. PUT5]